MSNEEIPRSVEAEEAVISCMMQHKGSCSDACLTLTEDAFYHPGMRLIYNHLKHMSQKGRSISLVTVHSRISDAGDIDKIGGPSTLAGLLNFVPTTALYNEYKSIILNKLMARRMIDACGIAIKKVREFSDEPRKAIQECASSVVAVRDELLAEAQATWGDRMNELEEEWNNRADGKVDHLIATPWGSFNREVGGIPMGYTLMLGPRKSGKSSFVGHVALSAGLKLKKRVDIFTYEVSSEDLVLRMVSTRTGIPGDIVFNPMRFKPTDVQRLAIRNAIREIKQSTIRVHDGVGLGAHDIASIMDANGTQLGAVDYLLRLPRPPEASPKEGTEGSMRENSRILFDATRGRDRKVCRALFVLNHTVETGDRAGESRWSSSPENDCDLCLVVEPDDCIHVKSRRNGAAGARIPVVFSGSTYSFKEK